MVLKMVLSERAFLVLEGQTVVPKRTVESGFTFQFPYLETALKDAVQKYHHPLLFFCFYFLLASLLSVFLRYLLVPAS